MNPYCQHFGAAPVIHLSTRRGEGILLLKRDNTVYHTVQSFPAQGWHIQNNNTHFIRTFLYKLPRGSDEVNISSTDYFLFITFDSLQWYFTEHANFMNLFRHWLDWSTAASLVMTGLCYYRCHLLYIFLVLVPHSLPYIYRLAQHPVSVALHWKCTVLIRCGLWILELGIRMEKLWVLIGMDLGFSGPVWLAHGRTNCIILSCTYLGAYG